MRYLKAGTSNIGSVLLSVIIAFFPKCAFCWTAYLSIFSSLGVVSMPYIPWLKPVMIGFFLVNLLTLFVIARKRKNYISFLISMTGAIAIMISTVMDTSPVLTYAGLAMIVTASLWNLFTRKLVCNV